MEFTKGDRVGYDDTGPIQKTRQHTNSLWLLGFMYFLILWSGVILYAFLEGHPNMYDSPIDSQGRVCGWDEKVYKSRYLVWYNRESCEQSRCLVCRPSCPKKSFTYVNKSNLTEGLKNSSALLEETLRDIICRPDVKLDRVDRWDQLDYLVENELCARSYSKTGKVRNQYWCGFEEKSDRFGQDDWRFTLPRLERDISRTRKFILVFIALSGLIAVASILILSSHGRSFACLSVLVLYSVLFNYTYEFCVIDAPNKTMGVLLFLVVSVALLVGLVFAMAYHWNQIGRCASILAECTKAILCVKSTLLLSIALAMVALTVLNLGFRVSLNLSVVESPVYGVHFAEGAENCQCSRSLDYFNGSSCDDLEFQKTCQDTDRDQPCVLSGCFMQGKELKSNWIWQIVNGVAVYWSFCLVVGLGDLTLAGVFATWYWTFNKPMLNHLVVLESFWRTCAYHIGTLVLGSLTILICSIIRGTLKLANLCLLKSNKPIAGLVLLHTKSIFGLSETFLDCIDRRAYVICAIHGTNFMESAKSAHDLVSRNIERIAVNFQLSNWLLLGLSLLISFTMSRVSTSYLPSDKLNNPAVPAVMIFVGSFVACFMILRVLEMAVETILYSLLEDGEVNGGERPSFLSEELAKVLFDKQ